MAAAALVPLIAGLAPAVIDLITRLVHGAAPAAEAQFGPKTGPVKYAAVFGTVIQALQQAAGVGTIEKQLPSDDTIKVIIQAVVTSMQISGKLDTGSAGPAPAAPAKAITLSPGQSITVTVAA